MLKRMLACFCALLLLCGCTGARPAQSEQSVAAQAAEVIVMEPAAQTPPPAPDEMPTPTPEPLPTPMITDAWYAARTAQIRGCMERFGSYASDEEIDAQLALWEIDPDKPMIALTFDDGPCPGVTDAILELLAQYNVRATFFVKGVCAKKLPEMMQRALAQGCEIGNHTYDHKIMKGMDGAQIRWEITTTNEIIEAATGVRPRLLRAPGGTAGNYVYKIAGECDMAVVRWSQSGNVNLIDPEQIAACVQHQEINGKDLRDGDIVLLHDTHDYMVEAVRLMLPTLIEQGYQLVTVSELLELSERGLVYGQFYKHQYSNDEE